MNQMHNYLKLSILVSLFSLPICLQAQDNSLAQLEADAAEGALLDDGGIQSGMTGALSRQVSGGAAADDDEIIDHNGSVPFLDFCGMEMR